MKIGVPTGTRRISVRRSPSPPRRQPADAAAPIVPGVFVPWMARRLPPFQPGRRVRLVAGQREDAAAVVGPVAVAGHLVGDREAAGRRRRSGAADRHLHALDDACGRPRSSTRRSDRSRAQARSSCGRGRARPSGRRPSRACRSGARDGTPSQRPRFAATARHAPRPNSVRGPSVATARPAGLASGASRCGRRGRGRSP